MHVLLRGDLHQRLRLASGLVLFAFAGAHFVNHALGLVSLEAMHQMQDIRTSVTRSTPGTVVLAAALLTHMALGLYKLATRRTLRLPLWEALQILIALAIPFLLSPAHRQHPDRPRLFRRQRHLSLRARPAMARPRRAAKPAAALGVGPRLHRTALLAQAFRPLSRVPARALDDRRAGADLGDWRISRCPDNLLRRSCAIRTSLAQLKQRSNWPNAADGTVMAQMRDLDAIWLCGAAFHRGLPAPPLADRAPVARSWSPTRTVPPWRQPGA